MIVIVTMMKMTMTPMEMKTNNLTLRCAATVELATSPRRLALGCAA